jgi:hypothetical protein
MSTALNPSPGSTGAESSQARLLATDTAVYVLLTLSVWLVWHITELGLFKAGDDFGYWIGVTGAVMMLLLLLYPLRKYLKFAQRWGSMKAWFIVHMLLGVGGPLLILLHSTFRIGSLNAGVALYSMVIVALSGVAGRFLYVRVHRNLRAEREDLIELRHKVRMGQTETRSKLAFAPEVEAMLQHFEEAELAASPLHLLAMWRKVFWLPVLRWRLYFRCVAALREPIRRLAAHGQWTDEELRRRERKARKLISRYSYAVLRVSQQTTYERMFSMWHVAHIPFVYLLILSAVVHVVAVHMY